MWGPKFDPHVKIKMPGRQHCIPIIQPMGDKGATLSLTEIQTKLTNSVSFRSARDSVSQTRWKDPWFQSLASLGTGTAICTDTGGHVCVRTHSKLQRVVHFHYNSLTECGHIHRPTGWARGLTRLERGRVVWQLGLSKQGTTVIQPSNRNQKKIHASF